MSAKNQITALMLLLVAFAPPSNALECTPTEPDMLGPFYKPDAPFRSSVGKGYVLRGMVRSARDCGAVPHARIEFWLAGPDREYDDKHRATVRADAAGAYRFESHLPPPYQGRPPHIHVRVSAPGYRTLVTQHYPRSGEQGATFDIVVVPGR